jgi:hypothetical protein
MSDEKNRRVWEQEDAAADRDHPVARDQASPAGSQANEGEGNRTATRAYNRKAKAFAENGPVEQQAQKAKADLNGPAGEELREAELVGRSHSHGEDPAVKSS